MFKNYTASKVSNRTPIDQSDFIYRTIGNLYGARKLYRRAREK